MAKILLYNNDTNRIETYHKGENEAMPYNTGDTLRVGEFRGASRSSTLWTTKRAMQSFNRQRALWGGPIPVGYAFKRAWEGGHANQSQHYAGTAFDVAQSAFGWSNAQRAVLRRSATNSGLWSYVEPVSISPTWVHFDRRQTPSACAGGGYPVLREGSRSVYVLILQDSLNTLGYRTGGLDGSFGPATQNAVQRFQRARGLSADGVVGCGTWTAIQSRVVGRGRTATTID